MYACKFCQIFGSTSLPLFQQDPDILDQNNLLPEDVVVCKLARTKHDPLLSPATKKDVNQKHLPILAWLNITLLIIGILQTKI